VAKKKSTIAIRKKGSAKKKPTSKAVASPITTSATNRHPKVVSKSKSGNVELVATDASADNRGFLIVGIGASAGGLEALQLFFDAMPSNKAMAFIVVTHQQGGHISLLPELLSKHTKMDVCEAVEGMQVEPNCVYLSPPDGQLQLLGSKLYVLPLERGLHLPIDNFFRSLAIDQKEHAIGIVLSGTGTDGTLGVKAIKGESGMVMVQRSDSAKYDGMPRSAEATGVADFILPPEQMPPQLLKYATGPFVAQAARMPLAAFPGLAELMPKIFVLLRNRTRHDFSHYKTNTVRRRIERRMSVHQIHDAGNYLRFLQENPHELDILFRELLIGVTCFFRDSDAFTALANDFLPKLVDGKSDGDTIRIWSAGCSTGEEAYSLAMVVQEAIDRFNPGLQLQVFATDLDTRAIDVARRGVYPEGIAADISPKRLQQFFSPEAGQYKIQKELRERLVFAPQDLISDPPFSKLDLLACRNVLIYLDVDLQKKLFPVFHYALNPGGLLFLGNSESIGHFTDEFEPLDKKWKIFERRVSLLSRLPLVCPSFALNLPRDMIEAPMADKPVERPADATLRQLLERQLLRTYAPPTVITSDRGEIVYIHGRTGAFLEPAPGGPSNNILSMAREGLQPTLSALLRRAAAEGGEVVQREVHVANNGNSITVDVVVRTIPEPEAIRGLLMITFETVSRDGTKKPLAPKKKARGRAAELEQELQFTRESLQTTIEELETANEELQSTNEEQQSTNEELETSKEEMQSLNEELQTVNSELQMKMEDLALVNDDMTNLLNNTCIATIFLDNDLNIKRFTQAASDVIKIIATDVGRPIGDLVTSLDYDLVTDAQKVVATLMTKESEAKAADGRWFRVRLMPYRTSENVIDGLVATFVEVTASKLAELQVAVAAAYAQSIVDTVREPLLVLDDETCIVSANESFYQTFQKKPAEIVGQTVDDLWNVPKLGGMLKKILPGGSTFEDFHIDVALPDGGKRKMLLNARRLEQAIALPGKILLGMSLMPESAG
jgi:two-component system, chemotaxis family, CheB/CheR fusion protein